MAIDFGRGIRHIIGVFPPVGYLFVPLIKLKDHTGTGEMHRDLDEFSRKFLTEEQLSDASFMHWLRRDVWYSFLRYHCPIDEYFLYHFYRLSPVGRHEFVTEYEKDAVCTVMSSTEVQDILADKGNAFRRFAPFYKRDVLPVDAETDLAALARFTEAHPRYIVKPRRESCGRGVHIAENTPPTEELLRSYQEDYVVLEELIRQDESLAKFHPDSVNTIRCATFYQNGETRIIFTFFRVGQGSSIVDNAGLGGLVASVDPDTGIVFTPACTERNDRTLIHPDTGVQILGAVIPRWDEMKALAAELAATIPEHPYVSWDLALTKDGWVMVEGNSAGQFVCPQLTRQEGLRRELRRFFELQP